MKIIAGERQSGKTTELIRISAVTGYPIVTFTCQAAEHVKRMAYEMGVKIPDPIYSGERGVSLPSKVLVDQIDYRAPSFDCNIAAATVDLDNIILLK